MYINSTNDLMIQCNIRTRDFFWIHQKYLLIYDVYINRSINFLIISPASRILLT